MFLDTLGVMSPLSPSCHSSLTETSDVSGLFFLWHEVYSLDVNFFSFFFYCKKTSVKNVGMMASVWHKVKQKSSSHVLFIATLQLFSLPFLFFSESITCSISCQSLLCPAPSAGSGWVEDDQKVQMEQWFLPGLEGCLWATQTKQGLQTATRDCHRA